MRLLGEQQGKPGEAALLGRRSLQLADRLEQFQRQGARLAGHFEQPTLLADLEALVEPTAPGDPESPLRWTSKSVRVLSVALEALGHEISHTVVAELLHELGYSLQGNAKTQEGTQTRIATGSSATSPGR